MLFRKITSVIKWLVRRLSNLSRDEWDQVIDAVVYVEDDLPDGESKRDYVTSVVRKLSPLVSAWVVNLVVELAVAYAQEKGYLGD